jgi:hypothetical protein
MQALIFLQSDADKSVTNSNEPQGVSVHENKMAMSRTNKHKIKLPGPNQLEKWRTRATEEDGNAVRLFMKRCAKWVKRNNDIPGNLFSREAIDKTFFLLPHAMINNEKLQMMLKEKGQILTKSNPVTKETPDVTPAGLNKHYPAISYSINNDIQGFDFLNFDFTETHGKEWKRHENIFELPVHYDNEGTYHSLFSYTMPAMLVNCAQECFDMRVKNIHIICKGFEEFNTGGVMPQYDGEVLIWYVQGDDNPNIDVFVDSVLESAAFQKAAKTAPNKQPLRRIVVWIMLKGHMEAFVWDQIYNEKEEIIHNVLFMMTTMPQKLYYFDEEIHSKLLNSFKKAMIKAELIDQRARLIIDLKCSPNLRKSMIKHTEDIACVMFTGFATLLLSTVLNFEEWAGDDIDKEFWDFCRVLYANQEKEFIPKTASFIAGLKALWICPAMSSKHVNINDVHLITVDKDFNKLKYSYNWDNGWTESRLVSS